MGIAIAVVAVLAVLLLVLAIGLIVAEGQLNTHGLLGAGGVVALILSGLLLFNTGEGADVSVPVVVVTGLLLGGFLAFAVERVIRARREPVRTGYEELVGISVEARTPLDPEGQVWAEGALWRARLADREGRVAAGDRVTVEAVDGLTLVVRRAPRAESSASEEGAG